MAIEIDSLDISYATEEGPLHAVQDVSFDIQEGETVGVVGESGCGKTTVAKSILGLLDDNGSVDGGEIRYQDYDLASFSERDFQQVRWTDISYIAQNAMNALDPVYRVGSQLIEVIRHHTDASKQEAKDRSMELLQDVGLDRSVYRDYPHELSGGQRQRVVIALALTLNPSFIIADEPTTGLDVVVQDEILQLIERIQEDTGAGMIFITHDMSAVAEVADRIAVMYGGRLVELGDISDVFKDSLHPYTMGLRNAFPSIAEEMELVSIPGRPPDLTDPPTGCIFQDRCPYASYECQTEPPFEAFNGGHKSKCHFSDEAESMREESRKPETWQTVAAATDDD